MEGQNVPLSNVEPPASAAGKNGSTLAELSHCAYLESCSRGKVLAERVENNTPLSSGRNDAIDEYVPIKKKRGRKKKAIDECAPITIDEYAPVIKKTLRTICSPFTKKRLRTEKAQAGENSRCALAWNVTSRPIEVSSNLVDVSSSEKDDSSDSSEIERSESDVLGGDRRKMNGNGGCGRNRVMFRDLGGISGVIEELKTEVIVPLHQVKLLRHLGVEPVARILLQGPLGCGKTTLVRAIANETGLPFYEVSAAELVSGAFEENIRELFSKAYMRAPSIVFIDEIDSITSKKENLQKEIQSRIVNRLMACMDESCSLIKPVNHNGSESSNSTCGYVLVIGATSRLDAVDPTLRQQFDREIVLGVPDESARLEILSVLTRNLKVEVGCDLAKIARSTMGFVGGDLVALAKKAGILAVNRIVHKRNLEISKKSDCSITGKDIEGNPRPPFSDEEMENFSITMEDFKGATRMVQPSSKIEEFFTVPNAKWDDVVGLQLLKQEFDCHIIRPIKFPDVYKDLGMNSTSTFFLYGPSGCGKTLIVEALANEARINFIHIKCSELLNKYADHGELVLRNIFSNARMWSPCILFFDEVEALAKITNMGHKLLTEIALMLENAEERRGVYIICATHSKRRDMVNYELSRYIKKGMLDKCMYVPHPSPEERGMILKALSGNKPIDADVDLMAIGKDVACENFSGADLSTLMKEATRGAIKRQTLFDALFDGERSIPVPWTIKDADFKSALENISPTVTPTVQRGPYFNFQGFL